MTEEIPQTEFKVIKLDSGEDIICKVLQEYSDALLIERPFAIREQNVMDHNETIVNQTGFSKWVSFTNDPEFVVYKNKILTMGNLAPEVRFYYKHLVSKMIIEEQNNVKTEEEALEKMRHLQEAVSELTDSSSDLEDITDAVETLSDDDGSNVLYFPPTDKDKLH
tara:strand:- start:2101 stop:2595 length:495 start_codon:yes stop_codon:yes gene_type:complete